MKNLLILLSLLIITPISAVICQTTLFLQPGPIDGKDAYATMNTSVVNTGKVPSLVSCAWTFGGVPGKARSFVAFDLSSIPEDAIIQSAALSLYYNPIDDIQSFDYHTGENGIYIQRVIESWQENTINWDNQPNTTTINQVLIPPCTTNTQDYIDLDVTELVKDIIVSPDGNNGFLIKMEDEINYYKSVLFASSDHIDANLHPKLVVVYDFDEPDLIATASAGFDVSNCYNLSYTLSGTVNNGNISWVTSGDGIFSNETTATPTYTFGENDILIGSVTLGIIVTGVSNIATDEMIITIKPQAIADAGSDENISFDEPYTLNGIASSGDISWSSSGNGTFSGIYTETPTYTFGEEDQSNGIVTLSIKVIGNCNVATDEIILSNLPNEVEPDFILSLYPNPSLGLTTIEVNKDVEFSVEIFNSYGQLLMEIPKVQSSAIFDVTGFAMGNYLVRIVNTDFIFTKKLVVGKPY